MALYINTSSYIDICILFPKKLVCRLTLGQPSGGQGPRVNLQVHQVEAAAGFEPLPTLTELSSGKTKLVKQSESRWR